MRQQQCQPLFHPASHTAVLTAPEQAVMDEDGVRLGSDSGFDQGTARSDARDNFANVRPAFHLQSIGTIVFKALRLQQVVQCTQNFSSFTHVWVKSFGKLAGQTTRATTRSD